MNFPTFGVMVALVFSSSALAALPDQRILWNDVALDQGVEISQPLSLGTVRLEPGERGRIVDIVGMDMIHVVAFVLKLDQCAHPESRSEMEIVLPQGSAEGAEVGVELMLNCEIRVYVESKDLLNHSFFY